MVETQRLCVVAGPTMRRLASCARGGRWLGAQLARHSARSASAPLAVVVAASGGLRAASTAGTAAVAAAALAWSAQASACAAAEDDVAAFPSKGDPYKGVSVSASDVGACASVTDFARKLEASLAEWRGSGRQGVWLQIPAARPELIAAAQSQGFEFHHAEPDYLMMCRWLGEGDSMLPDNASHSVGVGAVCINSRSEVLVVQEATGPAANRPGGFWKIPTGLVNAGEEVRAPPLPPPAGRRPRNVWSQGHVPRPPPPPVPWVPRPLRHPLAAMRA